MLLTKLHRPQVTKEHVYRDHLIDWLNKNMYRPFTLVSAGAGYGKSMLISSWIEKSKVPYAWVSLSDTDNEIREFIGGILTSVQKLFPNALVHLTDYLEAPELPPTIKIAESLINGLDEIEKDFVLVLDDYHLIQNMQINELINQLLQFPPQHMHLVIICRSDPFLNISSLRAHSRMNEVRMADLCFNESEILELLKHIFHIESSRAISHKLMQQTEGWITGLRLLLLMVKKGEDLNKSIEKIHAVNPTTANFLLEEVISNQPESIRECILKMSILDEFCAELVDDLRLLHVEDKETELIGKELIKKLVDSNLFTIPLDYERKWYRFHHLFRDLLLAELKKIETDKEINKYHIRASHWFEKHGQIEKAIRHALVAKNPGEACCIVERHRWTKLNSDKWYVVQRWLSFLPDELIWEKPELLLAEAWCAYENFTFEKVSVLLEQVKSLLKDNAKDRALLGECYLIQGLIVHWSGMGEAALELLSKAEELLPDIKNLALGMLYLHIALARGATGRHALAIEDLGKQISLTGGKDAVYDTRLMAGIYYVNMFAGNLQEARSETHIIQKTASEAKIVYTYAMGICQEGTACFHAYQLKEAENLFAIASENRYNLHRGTALDAMAGHALTLQLLGKEDQADEALNLLDSFEKEILQTNSPPISNSCRARILSHRGDHATALAWEENLEAPPSFAGLFIWLEVPILTQVRVLINHGSAENLQKAQKHLDAFLAESKSNHLYNQIIEGMVLQSVLLVSQGKDADAMKTLLEAIHLAEAGEWVRPFVEYGGELKELLAELPESNQHKWYINSILKAIQERESKQLNSIQIVPEKTAALKDNKVVPKTLSFGEIEVLKLVAQGLRNKEIADMLHLTTDSIKKRLYYAYQKLYVSNRLECVNKAKQLGLLDVN